VTQDELKQLARDAGGVLALAARLRVGKDWLYRRISGKTPIGHKDELAIRAVVRFQ
jgi:hypothetical protein